MAKYQYCVYVIELNPTVTKTRKFRKQNPNASANRPCFYVGQSCLSPEERFQNHKKGYKSCNLVKKYGIRLRPDLYKPGKAFKKRSQAEALESQLAQQLREQGYCAYAN